MRNYLERIQAALRSCRQNVGVSIPSVLFARILFVLSAAGIGLTYLGCIRWWGALLSLATLVWFAWPAVLVARRLLGADSGHAPWFLAPAFGIGVSLLGLLAFWAAGARAWWIIVAAPWPLWITLPFVRRWRGFDVTFPTFDRRDALALAVVLLLVPLIAGFPYAHVGEFGRDGSRAYRAYFTADFVWAMTVVAEVSKGAVPPHNPFQIGGTLHYYWLSHFLSAVEYRLARPLGLGIEEVILANSVGFAIVFIAFLYGFARGFGAAVWPAVAAVALVFLANSFEVLDRVVVWWSEPSLYPLLTDINVDAVTRWFYSSMPVDGLHRMILYQPHHLPGYAIGLSALLLAARAVDAGRGRLALAAGACLGLSLLLTSFTAIIFGVAVIVVYAVRMRRPSQWIRIPYCALLGAVPVAAAIELSRLLDYIDPAAQSLLTLGPNSAAFNRWQYALLLSFGPMLIIGAAGIVLATGTAWRRLWPIVALAIVALAFYFLVDVPDMQHVWVGWRAGHVLFIAATVGAAAFLTWARERGRTMRRTMVAAVTVLAIAALPTVAVDIYNAQDVNNVEFGSGFPWTLRLSAGEIEALGWLKSQTPPDVIVQPDVLERGNASWGYMTAFGERRMAAGLPIAMIPFKPYQDGSELVGDKIFNDGPLDKRAGVAQRLGIDYLYVGPVEQERHPDLVGQLDSRSDLFPTVFRNEEVVIYWVAPPERR